MHIGDDGEWCGIGSEPDCGTAGRATVSQSGWESLRKDDTAATISAAALEQRCPICAEALGVFVELYGAEAGNLALKHMATGGVFIGGGIAPKILPKLLEGVFLQAFNNKGRMESLLQSMPVKIILNDRAALYGPALFAASLCND